MDIGQPTGRVRFDDPVGSDSNRRWRRFVGSPAVVSLVDDLAPTRAQLVALVVLSVALALGLRLVEQWRGASGADELTAHYYRMVRYHERVDANVEPGSALFFGDSLIQGLNVAAVTPGAINYGIGQDTTEGLKLRISNYDSLQTARVVVLSVGINDVFFRSLDGVIDNYRQIIDSVSGPLVISAVMPTTKSEWNEQSVLVNRELERMASERSETAFVNLWDAVSASETGLLADAFHVGDGVHLNEKAASLWIDALRAAIDQVVPGASERTASATMAHP